MMSCLVLPCPVPAPGLALAGPAAPFLAVLCFVAGVVALAAVAGSVLLGLAVLVCRRALVVVSAAAAVVRGGVAGGVALAALLACCCRCALRPGRGFLRRVGWLAFTQCNFGLSPAPASRASSSGCFWRQVRGSRRQGLLRPRHLRWIPRHLRDSRISRITVRTFLSTHPTSASWGCITLPGMSLCGLKSQFNSTSSSSCAFSRA